MGALLQKTNKGAVPVLTTKNWLQMKPKISRLLSFLIFGLVISLGIGNLLRGNGSGIDAQLLETIFGAGLVEKR